jgi:hypothetical protein
MLSEQLFEQTLTVRPVAFRTIRTDDRDEAAAPDLGQLFRGQTGWSIRATGYYGWKREWTDRALGGVWRDEQGPRDPTLPRGGISDRPHSDGFARHPLSHDDKRAPSALGFSGDVGGQTVWGQSASVTRIDQATVAALGQPAKLPVGFIEFGAVRCDQD